MSTRTCPARRPLVPPCELAWRARGALDGEAWVTTRTASGWVTAPPSSWTRNPAVCRSTCAPPPATPAALATHSRINVTSHTLRHPSPRSIPYWSYPDPNPKQHPDTGECGAALHRDQLHVRLGRLLPARRARRLRAHPHGGEAAAQCSPMQPDAAQCMQPNSGEAAALCAPTVQLCVLRSCNPRSRGCNPTHPRW